MLSTACGTIRRVDHQDPNGSYREATSLQGLAGRGEAYKVHFAPIADKRAYGWVVRVGPKGDLAIRSMIPNDDKSADTSAFALGVPVSL